MTGEKTAGPMGAGERTRLLVYGGVMMTLLQFAVPYEGLIGLPVIFFLKNRLGLTAHDVATFNLIASIPLFTGFAFGFLRDSWSPFGRGDRAHILVFGLAAAAAYGAMVIMAPSYGVLLGGVLASTIMIQMVWAAGRGATSAVGQAEAMTGQVSVVGNLAVAVPSLAAYFLGGALSGFLESRDATSAAQTLFAVGGGLMIIIALMGALGPARLFEHHHGQAREHTIAADIVRLLRHKPLYPVMIIQLLWQFSPAVGVVMPFHLANDLHASDAQVGAWYGLFFGAFAPVYVLYAWLCRRVRLNVLLWVGSILAVTQMAPMLFAQTPNQALAAAVAMGVIGGVGQAAYTDLTIRACPPRLQGTMMMMFMAMYYVSLRLGDLFGAWLFDRQGGYQTALFASMGVYALIMPMLLLLPRQLTATLDGEPSPSAA